MSVRNLGAVLGFVLALTAASSFAAPHRLTFDLVSDVPRGIGGGGWPLASLPTAQYSIELDLQRPASIALLDGRAFESRGDDATGFLFRVDKASNHLTSPNAQPSDDWRYGQFSVAKNQNSWGTGPTYGTFDYTSRIDLVAGPYLDAVMIQGFWPDELNLNEPPDLMEPRALWIVTDFFVNAVGQQRDGSWFARLVAVEPTQDVSAPPTLVLALTALLSLRRSIRSGRWT